MTCFAFIQTCNMGWVLAGRANAVVTKIATASQHGVIDNGQRQPRPNGVAKNAIASGRYMVRWLAGSLVRRTRMAIGATA